MNQKPQTGEYAPYYETYISKVPEGDIIAVLEKQHKEMTDFLENIQKDKSNFSYAPGKWSVKEVIGHINDVERVFGYRALRISRKDETPIPGFEQDDYVANSNLKNIPIGDSIKEFSFLRQGNLMMFKSFADEMWLNKGIASNNNVTVRAIAYIIAGHADHHIGVLKEKYGL